MVRNQCRTSAGVGRTTSTMHSNDYFFLKDEMCSINQQKSPKTIHHHEQVLHMHSNVNISVMWVLHMFLISVFRQVVSQNKERERKLVKCHKFNKSANLPFKRIDRFILLLNRVYINLVLKLMNFTVWFFLIL